MLLLEFYPQNIKNSERALLFNRNAPASYFNFFANSLRNPALFVTDNRLDLVSEFVDDFDEHSETDDELPENYDTSDQEDDFFSKHNSVTATRHLRRFLTLREINAENDTIELVGHAITYPALLDTTISTKLFKMEFAGDALVALENVEHEHGNQTPVFLFFFFMNCDERFQLDFDACENWVKTKLLKTFKTSWKRLIDTYQINCESWEDLETHWLDDEFKLEEDLNSQTSDDFSESEDETTEMWDDTSFAFLDSTKDDNNADEASSPWFTDSAIFADSAACADDFNASNLQTDANEDCVIGDLNVKNNFKRDFDCFANSMFFLPEYEEIDADAIESNLVTRTGTAFLLQFPWNFISFDFQFSNKSWDYNETAKNVDLYSFTDRLEIQKQTLRDLLQAKSANVAQMQIFDNAEEFAEIEDDVEVWPIATKNADVYATSVFIDDVSDEEETQIDDLKINRVKFKPGYSRIWRVARDTLRLQLNLPLIYQHKLTKYLHRFARVIQQKNDLFLEMTVRSVLLSSHLIQNIAFEKTSVNGANTYVNGTPTNNDFFLTRPGDCVQLIVTLKFYIFNRDAFAKIEFSKIKWKKIHAFKTAAESFGTFKTPQSTMPKALFKQKSEFEDVGAHVEVDFLTLSVVILREPDIFAQGGDGDCVTPRLRLSKNYNWKYIT